MPGWGDGAGPLRQRWGKSGAQGRKRDKSAFGSFARTDGNSVSKGTVDMKVLKALRNKADLARTLVDDYRKGINPYES